VSEAPVTVEMVIKILNRNTAVAQDAIGHLVKSLDSPRSCKCVDAMASAIITNPAAVPPETRQDLDLLVKKYLK
jgi:5'-methylthioadenosine phosphorylase